MLACLFACLCCLFVCFLVCVCVCVFVYVTGFSAFMKPRDGKAKSARGVAHRKIPACLQNTDHRLVVFVEFKNKVRALKHNTLKRQSGNAKHAQGVETSLQFGLRGRQNDQGHALRAESNGEASVRSAHD